MSRSNGAPGSGVHSRAAAALAGGALVVTATERAARQLRLAYDAEHRAVGVGLWEPPAIRSWASWIDGLWRDLLLTGHARALLLNPLQEHALWRRAIEQASTGGGALAADRLAEMAAAAWAELGSFRGHDRLRRGANPGWLGRGLERSADTDAFARWAATFDARCRQDGVLSGSELEGALAEALEAGDLTLTHARLVLLGFDQLTPAQEVLASAARNAGVVVDLLAHDNAAGSAIVVRAVDAVEELDACAQWCAEKIADGRSVALVVPEVAGERAELGRALRAAIARIDPAVDARAGVFAFESDGLLVQQELVTAALDLLRLAAGPLPLEQVSRLLLSRYVGVNLGEAQTAATGEVADTAADLSATAGGREWAARAEFDAFELRPALRIRQEITLRQLIHELRQSPRFAQLTVLTRALRRLERRLASPLPVRRSYGGWAETMRRLLRAADWGARQGAETAGERHLHELWESALDALATLDFLGERVSFAEALGAMTRIMGQRRVTYEDAGAPLQVLSLRDAAGCRFDAMWCLRAGESTWAAPGRSHALLPWQMQRELGMPGSDRARDDASTARTLDRLRASAPEIVFSYAAHANDAVQRAVAGVRAMQLEERNAAEPGSLPPREPVELEPLDDREPLSALPDRVQHGGARILEAQAACAFRAFAEHRLWSTAPQQGELGLDRGRRGTAVHHALEWLWGEIGSQSRLRAMTFEERRAAIAQAAEGALNKASKLREIVWDEAYLDVQRERLQVLLKTWLDLELRRPAFKVETQERVVDDARIGPLRLSLRIDRVDLVGDTRVLIDYKTGSAACGDWNGERPDAPQLPLYAALSSGQQTHTDDAAERLGAVAFASVHAGKGAKLEGFAEREGIVPVRSKVMEAPTFSGQLDRWREVLEHLAEEFAAGDATVYPKSYPETCRRCEQRMLCRLDASALDEPDEELNGDDDRG